MVRRAPGGIRILTRCALVLLLALASACAGSPGRRGGTDGAAPEAGAGGEGALKPWETYVRNPTELRADEVTALLPARWGEDVELRGLSAGFTENEDGWRTWRGTGDCRLALYDLKIRAKKLTVTLVPGPGEPEVILQAEGNVVLAHVSKGIGNLSEGVEFLHIRNDKRLER